MRALRIALPLVAALSLTACGFNSIPTKEEAVNASWGEVENQYQRRADLVPNLVATVQGYAKQEQDVLVGVTEARAKATQTTLAPGDLSDPAKVAAFQQAQDGLSSALSRLMVVVEKYPDLKSNQNFLALQSQLEGTENRISVARRDFNTAVQAYNTEIRTFPSIIAAKTIYGSEPKAPFKATTANAEVAPTVKF
jgi:LemA protein